MRRAIFVALSTGAVIASAAAIGTGAAGNEQQSMSRVQYESALSGIESTRARIDARYQVDRARCGAQSGIKRDRCLIRAHAAKGRAMLDAAAPYEVRYRP